MREILKTMVLALAFASLYSPAWAQEKVSLEEHFREGMARYASHDYAGAIHTFEGALKERPGDVRLLYYLGYAYYKNGDFEDARASFDEAYRLRQNFTPLPKLAEPLSGSPADGKPPS